MSVVGTDDTCTARSAVCTRPASSFGAHLGDAWRRVKGAMHRTLRFRAVGIAGWCCLRGAACSRASSPGYQHALWPVTWYTLRGRGHILTRCAHMHCTAVLWRAMAQRCSIRAQGADRRSMLARPQSSQRCCRCINALLTASTRTGAGAASELPAGTDCGPMLVITSGPPMLLLLNPIKHMCYLDAYMSSSDRVLTGATARSWLKIAKHPGSVQAKQHDRVVGHVQRQEAEQFRQGCVLQHGTICFAAPPESDCSKQTLTALIDTVHLRSDHTQGCSAEMAENICSPTSALCYARAFVAAAACEALRLCAQLRPAPQLATPIDARTHQLVYVRSCCMRSIS